MEKFGKAQVDLFADAKSTYWKLWFSLTKWDSLLGEDAEAHVLYYHLHQITYDHTVTFMKEA